MKYLIASIVISLSTSAFAQDSNSDKTYFFTRAECWPSEKFMQMVMTRWGEDALFTGTSMTFGQDGKSYQGGMMFFVNQDSGTWTLANLYADGTICIQNAGTDFSPFSIDKSKKGDKS